MLALTAVGARFVHLVRRDLLSAVVSFDIAQECDRWHYYEGDAVKRRAMRADTKELLTRLRERDADIERFRRRLRHLPVPVHEVVYEDLVARRDEVLRDVTAFLGVPAATRPLRSESSARRRGEQPTSSRTGTRFGAALAGTEYGWLAA